MSWPIGMPNLGHTMEEGLVQEWLKKPGDPVITGEVIAIVESDKASFDIESPSNGILLAIDVPGGQKALVGTRIGLVGVAGESVQEAMVQSFTGGVPNREAVPVAPCPDVAARSRIKISPAARVLAEELDVELSDVAGSGEDGMITRDDVRGYAASRQQNAGLQPRHGTRKPLSPMRKAISAATLTSWNSVPHVALQSHAMIDGLPESVPLTAAVVRAAALALLEFPGLNGWLHGDDFEPAFGADIGVAVATDTGLLTVVVRQAQEKSVQTIDGSIRTLADSARKGKLSGEQTLGASFTISSLGRWGVDNFAPIISAPQVAILGIGRVVQVARPDLERGVRFCRELPLTLVFDHRANDGVMAARFLAAVVKNLEQTE